MSGLFPGDGGGATRTRPVSANTRLRQKPPAANDFFASLGIEQPRERTGSSASTSSNRSFSNVTARASPAPSWRPPPIGGLGRPVTTQPPAPSGMLSTAGLTGLHRPASASSMKLTTPTPQRPVSASSGLFRPSSSSSMTMRSRQASVESTGGMSVTSVKSTTSVSAASMKPSSSATATAKPTQLFSMDAEELYSDDDWGVDSPSAVLKEEKKTETKDEFAWADDDEAFVSPVAKTAAQAQTDTSKATFTSATTVSSTTTVKTVESTPPPAEFAWTNDDEVLVSPVAQPAAQAEPPKPTSTTTFSAAASPFAMTATASAFEYKAESTLSPPPAEFAWGDDDDALVSPVAAESAKSPQQSLASVEQPTAFEISAGSQSVNAVAAFETKVESTPPPPQDEFAWGDGNDAFVSATESVQVPEVTPSGNDVTAATESISSPAESNPSVSMYNASEPQQHAEQHWGNQWSQGNGNVDMAAQATSNASAHDAPVNQTTGGEVPTHPLGAPPVELTSPGAAAGEFWGDGDDDAGLFDHDEHADEEWDDTIKEQEVSLDKLSLSPSDNNPGESTVPSMPTTSPPPLPPSAVAVETFKSEEEPSMASEISSTQNDLMHAKEPFASTEEVPAFEGAQATVSQQSSHDEQESSGAVENSQDAKPTLTFDTESSPFSSAIAAPPSENDTNAYPDAPPNVRFLHTPTGTGGPFGRVPSPQGAETSNTHGEFSGSNSPEAFSIQEPPAQMAASAGDVPTTGPFTDSSNSWDVGSMHSNDHNREPVEDEKRQERDENQQIAHQGQSDEEERDSVVSFSGSNSFFPSAGRPSSLYGGSQSSFASHRMYQSSTASTDHDGSSIASFGVSSTGATFGGSERVSEGGAFSDGTVSETPSLVDSSNASTAFGTDFPSVSEGQFSAPGTTIGGSDNASDGGFSDGNASETTSMCESVNTNPRFVSEFHPSSGHYVTESVERHDDTQEQAATDSEATFGGSVPSNMFGSDDSSADVNPFASSANAFPSSQSSTSVPAPSAPNEGFAQPKSAAEDESVPSASSLFGATAGADVPNPFSSFGAPPVAAPAETVRAVDEHELPTSDAGDLFGSSAPSTGFGNSFDQPAQQSFNSGYQTQSYNQTSYSTGQSAFGSSQAQYDSAGPFDQPRAEASNASPFETHSSASYNHADPFAQSGAQRGFGSPAPSADAVFSSGGYSNSSDNNLNASSHFGGNHQASADAVFGGQPRMDNTGVSATSTHFEQHSTSEGFNASYGGHQGYNQYGQGASVSSEYSAQSTGANHRAADHFSRQSSTSSLASNSAQHQSSGFTGQNRHSNQQFTQPAAPRTPDNYSRQSAANAFARGSPAHSAYSSEHSYSHQQFGQNPASASSGGYGDHVRSSSSASADAFFGRSTAETAGTSHYAHGTSGGYGDHARSASSASADAYFGHSAGATGGSTASHFDTGRPLPPSLEPSAHQAPPQAHAQASLTRSGSNSSSFSARHESHQTASTPKQPSQGFSQSHSLNTSTGSIENSTISRHASSSSMSQYAGTQSQSVQQQEWNTPAPSKTDANAFFGHATGGASASSFFGGDASEQVAEPQMPPQEQTSDVVNSEPQGAASFQPPEQGHEFNHAGYQDQYPQNESNHYGYESEQFGGGAPPTESVVEGEAKMDSNPVAEEITPSTVSNDQHGYNEFGGSSSLSGDFASSGAPHQETTAPIVNEPNADRPQAFDGFGSEPGASVGQTPSDFFSSTPQAASSASAQFQQASYGNDVRGSQQQHVQEAPQIPQHFGQAQPRASYDHNAPSASAGNYFESGRHGAETPASPGAYSHEYQQQPQQPQQYQQYQQQQQQQQSHGYGYHGESVGAHPQAPNYHGVPQQHGTATGYGYGASSLKQNAYPAATPAVKTSNKYKDPCVAPPSCLASFGFGGNVVTMFPKRKLRLNIAGSGFRNSPRGVPAQQQFDGHGNGELRKGPVNVYRMDQLHPNDKEFDQMDAFPGPLTEDVSDEAILEYIDDRLKRSEAPENISEVEDENERLLLGVLRVMVKCNGKLRSDQGAANPTDPDSPEAQLVALLSESGRRRNGNQQTAFSSSRKSQPAVHPDLLAKRSNELRELLLVGDRKGAVATAMNAHMWPEAMLIASFTDKEEYRRVLRMYLDEHYSTGDPCRALFMAFADQQEKSVQEPKRLLQTHDQTSADSRILSSWVSHAQVLLANRTADTNKILTELGDRLWTENNAVAAAHVCYLLAGIQVEAPMPTSKMALLGGDHRTPKEARFYVSPGAVQRTEIYEWAQKHSKGASANLMIPFQGYKLIYAMILADHGKLETAFKYVTSMLTVIKAVTATMKPGTSMYLEGMKNQLTVLDDRLRQHLGQDRVASVAASTSRGGSRKQGKWGLGSALSIMGKIVNRVVEGGDSNTAAAPAPNAATPGGLYANQATPPAASYPSTPTVTTPSPSPSLPQPPQQHVQQTPPTSSHGPSSHAPAGSYNHATPPTSSHGPSSHGPSPVPVGSYGHATPPMSQGSAPGSSNGYNRPAATPFARPGASAIPPSGPFSGNGRPGLHHQQSSGPFSGNGKPSGSGPFSNGPSSRGRAAVPPLHSQHSMEPPGSNHSTHSTSSSSMPPAPMNSGSFYQQQQQQHQQQQQPPSSQTSQHSHDSQPARATPPTFQKPPPVDVSDTTSNSGMASQPKTPGSLKPAESAALPPTPADAAMSSGPASDKGKSSPRVKKPARSKTPPPSGSSKASGWLSGLSSFIATKMNPEAKVAKLGEHLEAYYDEKTKRWVFPGETASEEPTMPSAPPTGPMPGSAPGSMAAGAPPPGSNSAPGSMSSGPAPSDDPLAALMAPPPSHMLMKKDPLAAMMAPPARSGMYGARRGSTAQRKPPRPQFAVFKPSAAPAPEPDQSE